MFSIVNSEDCESLHLHPPSLPHPLTMDFDNIDASLLDTVTAALEADNQLFTMLLDCAPAGKVAFEVDDEDLYRTAPPSKEGLRFLEPAQEGK